MGFGRVTPCKDGILCQKWFSIALGGECLL
jgi:hypothetical protein